MQGEAFDVGDGHHHIDEDGYGIVLIGVVVSDQVRPSVMQKSRLNVKKSGEDWNIERENRHLCDAGINDGLSVLEEERAGMEWGARRREETWWRRKVERLWKDGRTAGMEG